MILLWWGASSLLGVLALPLVFRLFKWLPDRGYAFARPLGLLGSSYLLWLGASLGILPNHIGGVIGALVLFGVVSLLMGDRQGLLAWLRSERRLVLTIEAVFAVSFAIWAFVRANNPEIQFTEKPMEVAFLNGILRSGSYPPIDPWLSGYGISYYYFGYVMIGQLTQLTGASSGVAFNLTSALWFAMVAMGSYGLLYNLLAAGKQLPSIASGKKSPTRGAGPKSQNESRSSGGSSLATEGISLWLPLLGPLFVLIAGNLEAFLDVLHSQHLFWTSGNLTSPFWSWLDIQQLSEPPVGDPSWIPQRFLWWWRASRVVHDVNLVGASVEVIDEFPFFSFLLADNHPHLLAIPYTLTAIGFSLQTFLRGAPGPFHFRQSNLTARRLIQIVRLAGGALLALVVVRAGLAVAGIPGGQPLSVLEATRQAAFQLLLLGAAGSLLAILALVLTGNLPSLLDRREFAFAAWLFGGLAFLNTWDSPIYLVLLVVILAWINRRQPMLELIPQLVYTALAVGIAAVLLYLPWYPSFSSQAGGVLVNVLFPTRIQHFLVMFGVALVPILVWLVAKLRAEQSAIRLDWIWKVGLGLLLALLLGAILLGAANYLALTRQPAGLESVLQSLGISGLSLREGVRSVLSAAISRRLGSSWTALILCLLVGVGVALLGRRMDTKDAEQGTDVTPFVICLVVVGSLLVLAPEFVYLRDLFGTRMNTVFKFYFGAWILWGLAGAYATAQFWPTRWTAKAALRLLVALPLLLGLVYPVLATWTKANGFNPNAGRTLDGTAYLGVHTPGDLSAIDWIQQNLPTGVIAEAVGGSYSEYGRIAAYTGLPTVLGWGGHEVQWRGNAGPQGTRQADIQRLYETSSWPEAAAVLEQYGIDYVYIGELERASYPRLNENKFARNSELIYQSDAVRIYSRGASR